MEKRTWTSDETFTAQIEIAHFGPRAIRNVTPTWTIAGQGGKLLAQGKLARTTVFLGNGTSLGEVRLPLSHVRTAQKLVLTVALPGTPYTNDWDFWVYPAAVNTTPPSDILVTDELSAPVLTALKSGAKVLWMPRAGTVKGDQYGQLVAYIFWNGLDERQGRCSESSRSASALARFRPLPSNWVGPQHPITSQ